eukprot:3290286-Rhodomonas_salina.1
MLGTCSASISLESISLESHDTPGADFRNVRVRAAIAREAANRQAPRRSKVVGTNWGLDVDLFLDRFRLLSDAECDVLDRLASPALMAACLTVFRQRAVINDAVEDLGLGRISADKVPCPVLVSFCSRRVREFRAVAGLLCEMARLRVWFMA